MRPNIPSLVGIGILTAALSSCSLMGSRQESTKKDLEESSIPQLKILTSKGGTPENTEDEPTSTLDASRKVSFEMRFLHPSLDTRKYVQDKKINLKQIMGEESMPSTLDRASLFFAYNGKISGDFEIKQPNDNLKESIGYSEQASLDKQQELIAKNSNCENHITETFAEGSAKFNLNELELDDIGKNTVLDDSGTTARDELIKLIQDEEKKKTGSEDIDVTSVVFGKLPQDAQDGIKALFKPKLGILFISKTVNLQTCLTPSNEASAFVYEQGQYHYIPPESIAVSDEDGKKKLKITNKEIITSDKLKELEFNIQNTGQKIAISSLKLTSEDPNDETKKIEVPVFSDDQHQKESTYTLVLPKPENTQPKTEEVKEEKKEEPKKDESVVENKKDATDPKMEEKKDDSKTQNLKVVPVIDIKPPEKKTVPAPSVPNTTVADPEAKKDEKTTYFVPILLQSNDQFVQNNKTKNDSIPVVKNEQKNTKPAGDSSSTKLSKKEKEIVDKVPEAIVKIPDIVTTFTRGSEPTWFNPKINSRHAKEFYKIDGEEIEYDPGEKNFKFWDISQFETPLLSTDQVKQKCAGYQYSRSMKVRSKLSQPWEATQPSYFTFSNNVTKTYTDVLFDQFSVDSNDDEVIHMIVNAALDTPPGLKEQEWSIKICFGPTKKFEAFLTTNETRANNYYLVNNRVVLTGDETQHWLQISTEDKVASGWSLPKNFNPLRAKYPLSLLSFSRSKNSDYYGTFQLDWKRILTARKIMGYLNTAKINAAKVKEFGVYIDVSKQRILEGIEKSFRKNPNKNEIVVFGGFKFDPTKTGDQEVSFLTPQQLEDVGVISAASYVPDVIGNILFPGENSELYLNVSLIN